MQKLGIVIPTYQRGDGTTPKYLTRALESIKNQTYQNYHIYLVGDKYEDNEEFTNLATSIIDQNKITYINLPIALERERYKDDKVKLWNSGGVNASNYGIELALKDGINYVCRLDHDDWWEMDHLQLISENLDDNIIIATLAKYTGNRTLPKKPKNPFYPEIGDTIHSSTCVKFSEIPLRYRDVFLEEGRILPSDGDLWGRLTHYLKVNKKKGHLINKLTVHHVEENR